MSLTNLNKVVHRRKATFDLDEQPPSHLASMSTDNSMNLMEKILLLGIKDRQGYLSPLNDVISYVLRGCILLELSFQRRIRTVREHPRRNPPERRLEVIDSRVTGDVLLDETLKLIRSEKHSIGGWVDLLSGEIWNPLKLGYQLRQVRERIAKGLVDKGILRTEKQSFIVFDMATHPVANPLKKDEVVEEIRGALLGRHQNVRTETLVLIACALVANVLDPVLQKISKKERESAVNRAESLLRDLCREERTGNDIIAGVCSVFVRMDSFIS